MSHLQRISWILGTLLLGASALVVYSGDIQRARNRRGRQVPVEQLAETLKEAWAGHHTP